MDADKIILEELKRKKAYGEENAIPIREILEKNNIKMKKLKTKWLVGKGRPCESKTGKLNGQRSVFIWLKENGTNHFKVTLETKTYKILKAIETEELLTAYEVGTKVDGGDIMIGTLVNQGYIKSKLKFNEKHHRYVLTEKGETYLKNMHRMEKAAREANG